MDHDRGGCGSEMEQGEDERGREAHRERDVPGHQEQHEHAGEHANAGRSRGQEHRDRDRDHQQQAEQAGDFGIEVEAADGDDRRKDRRRDDAELERQREPQDIGNDDHVDEQEQIVDQRAGEGAAHEQALPWARGRLLETVFDQRAEPGPVIAQREHGLDLGQQRFVLVGGGVGQRIERAEREEGVELRPDPGDQMSATAPPRPPSPICRHALLPSADTRGPEDEL
jgi:hypothetical protein